MIRYRDLPAYTSEVLDLTSLTVDELTALVPPFETAFLNDMAEWTLHGPRRQAQRYTTYQNCPLPTPEDRLLFMLVYLKQNPTQLLRGPTRHTPSGSPLCHEGTERPIPRPHNATAQKACDRGKNTRHMRKNLLLINAALRMLFLSETPPGSGHDKRIADMTPYPLPAGSRLLQDLGVQAFTLDGVEIMQPMKKPRGKVLTRAQKAGDRQISRRRVRIEQVNSRVKRGRMLKETIRVWKAGIRDVVMEIGCALHNFRVRLTPSWTPMA